MEQQVQKGITVILTSCGRFDLLAVTLKSFFEFNTYPVAAFYVYEDSGLAVPEKLKTDYPSIEWIQPQDRTGQILALDTLWSKVDTGYVFQTEDDWQHYRSNFIEDSIAILEKHPKIIQVWLREKEDTNQHPVSWPTNFDFGLLSRSNGVWAGFSFNPGVKRKADYDLIKSFGKHTQFLRHQPWKSEAEIAQLYHRLGFQAAITKQGYLRHIGGNRHVT